jgi:hypothetical protein
MAEDDNLALFFREQVKQATQFFVGLAADQAGFGSFIAQTQDIKDVKIFGGADYCPSFVAPMVIYAQVVGNPGGPLKEFSFVVVFSTAQGIHDFDENLLKDVLGEGFVLDEQINGCVNLAFMSIQKNLESIFIATNIAIDQFLI